MSFILALLQRSTTFSCPRTCRSTPNTRTLRVVAEAERVRRAHLVPIVLYRR